MNTDTEFETYTLESFSETEGGFTITADGWSLGVENKQKLPLPKVGEEVRLFGKGIGRTVRGVEIGGRLYSYCTEEENEARRVAEQAARDVKKKQEWAADSACRG